MLVQQHELQQTLSVSRETGDGGTMLTSIVVNNAESAIPGIKMPRKSLCISPYRLVSNIDSSTSAVPPMNAPKMASTARTF